MHARIWVLEFEVMHAIFKDSKLVGCTSIGYWVCLKLILSAIIKAHGMVWGVAQTTKDTLPPSQNDCPCS